MDIRERALRLSFSEPSWPRKDNVRPRAKAQPERAQRAAHDANASESGHINGDAIVPKGITGGVPLADI